ncbi:MAG TPA: hypothetical protein PLL94_13315 [Bacteroidales bacterium]|jgi:hypothetical protein|nr:MAG: hypothetical protein BWX96_02134 [Bacteroidetes bacterium ADurb.Bin145]HOU03038.1 hypothetical protein [Bacteroidales bacterium]HQK69112.1 hypothetical protein [Bacteroidales bacterium]
MKLRTAKTLQILTGIYLVLYVIGIVSSLLNSELSFLNLSDNLFLLLFLIFISGFVLCWKQEKIAGIILMIWNAGIWAYGLFLNRHQDGGMFCVMAVPVLVLGTLLILRWYKSSVSPQPSVQQQWKFILRVLLINYLVLYIIVVISEITNGKHTDYFSLPYILFPMLLLIFCTGFILSWKREFLAGLLFIFWYAILTLGSVTSFEFRGSGPWILFGVPILLQGLFYIKNHFQYKPG